MTKDWRIWKELIIHLHYGLLSTQVVLSGCLSSRLINIFTSCNENEFKAYVNSNIYQLKEVELKYQYQGSNKNYINVRIVLNEKYSHTFIHLFIQNSYRTLLNEMNDEINIVI